MRPILVAATSSASALEDLARSPANDRRVDWVEARLDQTPSANWDRALRAIDALEASGTPVLATLRSVQEGGGLEDDEARVARYRELLPRVHAIDVELASVHAPALVTAAHAAGKKVVLSSHDFARTPEQKSIEAFVRRGLGLGADIVKIACKVDAPDVYPRLLAALSLAPAGRLAILGMGPYGVALRVFLPAAGSALAFAYLDAPTAPGQLSVPELAAILEKIVPGYVPGQHLPIDG